MSKSGNDPFTLRGLVLAGGKSTRMGEDKGLLIYHHKPQRIHCFDLLSQLNLEAVHISCRKDQQAELRNYRPIADKAGRAGPMFILNHIFELYPQNAWLLLPCDVPLMDAKTLNHLILNRDPKKIATAFRSPTDGKPEPLLAIWEPSAFPLIQTAIAAGNYSPRKLLIESDAKLLDAPNPEALLNANSPADKEKIQRILQR